MDLTDPPIMWEGADGVLPGQVVLLADGSTVRINTGPNPWARTDPERPIQMWTVGSFHLDDGPLTPAASAFLGDLLTALQEPGTGIHGPSSHWLAQRATLDPTTHQITEPGVATPVVDGARTLVWDAAQGWVDAVRAGGLARAVDDVLLPGHMFANGPAAEEVIGGAGRVLELIDRTEHAEQLDAEPGTPEHDAAVARRALLRADLRGTAGNWVAASVGQTVAEFVGGRAQVVAESNGRLLVRLDGEQVAVAVVAGAENDALDGSRPGLQQAGTETDIGQLRNELAASPETKAWAWVLTRRLQQGLVRHVRVQGVLAAGEFVGMRVTEFEVTRPPHDQPGAARAGLERYRYVDPGLAVRRAMDRAMAGWTPSSITDAIDNALRWLPHVNPLHTRFPVTDRMPWSNNCGDCSRAVADLVQGRDARAAFGDNGARAIDSYRWWGTGPGELREMWRWAGVVGGWYTWHGDPASFTQHANARIGQALAAQPEGTVAIVLVNWADQQGVIDRGHWFNAAVTEDGVEWIDGQTAEHSAWPPPYTKPYYGYSVITRAQGSDTWVDLFGELSSALPGPTSPFVPGSIRDALAGQAVQPSPVRPVLVPIRDRLLGPGPSAQGTASYSFAVDEVEVSTEEDAQAEALGQATALADRLRNDFIAGVPEALGGLQPSRARLKMAAVDVPKAAGALVTADGRVFTHTSMTGGDPTGLHPVVVRVYEVAANRLGEAKADWHGWCAEVALISDVLLAAEEQGDCLPSLPGPDSDDVDWLDSVEWANRVLHGSVVQVVGVQLPTSVPQLTSPAVITEKVPCTSCASALGRWTEAEAASFGGVHRIRLALTALGPHAVGRQQGDGLSPSAGMSTSLGIGSSARGVWTLYPADAAFAARIANYAGDWPEDDERRAAEPEGSVW
jgi:hypothetical protein